MKYLQKLARGGVAVLTVIACASLPVLAHAQSLVQVPSKRAIAGAPPLYQSQPDSEISGRYVNFTAIGCALSFSAASVRGLTWNGACARGRMQGQGTVIGYDDEQQPMFYFEGHIERGLRANGDMYEVARKDERLIGWRTAIAGSTLRPHTEVPFLDMPRPFLLALDDWSRQTDGKDLLASMGATWAPTSQRPAAPLAQDLLGAALTAAASGNTAAERRQLALQALAGNSPNAGSRGAAAAGGGNVPITSPVASGSSPSSRAVGGNNECSCIEVLADAGGEILRNTCNYPIVAAYCVVGHNCDSVNMMGGDELNPRGVVNSKWDAVRIQNGSKSGGRIPWGYAAQRPAIYFKSAQTSGTNTWTKAKGLDWVCSEIRQPATLPGPHDKQPVLVR